MKFLDSQDSQLTPQQVTFVKDAISRTKEKLARLTIDHRDLHVLLLFMSS
jgi:hypothetical protein